MHPVDAKFFSFKFDPFSERVGLVFRKTNRKEKYALMGENSVKSVLHPFGKGATLNEREQILSLRYRSISESAGK